MPVSYETAYAIHLTSVTVSLAWFLVRAWLMLTEAEALHLRFNQSGPHVVDTILLGSAIYLAILLHQYPFEASWLTAKLTALIIYIVSGAIALKRGKTMFVRKIALVVSLLCAAYIISVALTKNALPYLI